jgi:hypothetical protein
MDGGFISLATSLERETLERLEKYLSGRGTPCWVGSTGEDSDRFALFVHEADAGAARRVLQDIVLPESAEEPAEEVVEIRCNPEERDAIAAWLQSLLEEQDEEGTQVFFYRAHYEQALDALLADSRAEIPVFLLRGLHAFLPDASRRLMMSPALREFFQLIDAVSEPDADEE